MIEVELKGYADSKVFERVKESFKFLRREYHEDTYYQHPCRDFSRTDEALRIRVRRFNGHFEAFLTYKGPKIDEVSKTREEIEAMVEDEELVPQTVEKLRTILEELGVERFERRSYLELMMEKGGENGAPG